MASKTFKLFLLHNSGDREHVFGSHVVVPEGVDPIAEWARLKPQESAIFTAVGVEPLENFETAAAQSKLTGHALMNHRYVALYKIWPPSPLAAAIPKLAEAKAEPGPRKPPRTVTVQEWLTTITPEELSARAAAATRHMLGD